MAKENMTLRIEPELKKEASELFRSMGLDLSTATGIFYRQCLRTRSIPFEIRSDEPNEKTYLALESAEKGEVEGPFDTVEDLMGALNA